MPPPYSPQLLISIQRTITQERLTRYLGATHQDVSRALELYEYNVQLSEVLYGLLHGLEVAVRNSEHLALAASYGTPAWYDLVPLSPHWQKQLQDAKIKHGVAATPGKLLAEFTLGFWVDLLKSANHRRLWFDKKLYMAFPNAHRPRAAIHQRLKAIQLLRNRISHHEPVLTASNTLYNGDAFLTLPEVLECVEWVCTDTAQWIKAHFRYADAERILRDVTAMNISL